MTSREYALAAARVAIQASADAGEPAWANMMRWDAAFEKAMAECASDELRAAAYDDAEVMAAGAY